MDALITGQARNDHRSRSMVVEEEVEVNQQQIAAVQKSFLQIETLEHNEGRGARIFCFFPVKHETAAATGEPGGARRSPGEPGGTRGSPRTIRTGRTGRMVRTGARLQ